jgi:tripartite-type tricarboxylate transporter receptor subunit TctC
LKRSDLAPDIPTVDEALGIKGFEAGLWNVVAAPAGTPQPIIKKLNEATRRVVSDPVFGDQLHQIGIDPITDSTPETARVFIEKERARFKPVVDSSGVQMD